jgi:hypothetical protein
MREMNKLEWFVFEKCLPFRAAKGAREIGGREEGDHRFGGTQPSQDVVLPIIHVRAQAIAERWLSRAG